jgi:hypothetical protein
MVAWQVLSLMVLRLRRKIVSSFRVREKTAASG